MFRKHQPETILSIIQYHEYTNYGISFEKALDIFTESVENYKNATKRKKLSCVAECFIAACLVAYVDVLTGAQAFDVFDDVATDYGADKDILEKAINKLMIKKRRKI